MLSQTIVSKIFSQNGAYSCNENLYLTDFKLINFFNTHTFVIWELERKFERVKFLYSRDYVGWSYTSNYLGF